MGSVDHDIRVVETPEAEDGLLLWHQEEAGKAEHAAGLAIPPLMRARFLAAPRMHRECAELAREEHEQTRRAGQGEAVRPSFPPLIRQSERRHETSKGG